MRDWIIIAVLAGLAFLGLRQCGCVGAPETASASEGESVDAGSAESIQLEAVKNDESGPERPASQASRSQFEELERLGGRLLDGEHQASVDRVQEIARSSEVEAIRHLADAVLSAFGPDRIAAWMGMSRLYEAMEPGTPESRRVLQRVEGMARLALRKPKLSVSYKVVPGDSLVKIRRKVRQQHAINVSPGMLRWLNELRGDTIYPDQELRVPREPVELGVSMQEYVLRVYVSGGLVREYPVGLGKEDRTPVETFVLKAPMEKAPWKDPVSGKIYHFGDPEYAIGTRWIGFEPKGPHAGLGIHGTNQPESIGKAESLGCIRLRNADVEALAELVAAGNLIRIVE